MRASSAFVRRVRRHRGPSLALIAAALLFGCGDEDPGLGEVDPALVGRWSGTVNFQLGREPFEGSLNADATLLFEGNFPKPGGTVECPLSGRWGVRDGVFRVQGNDECDGTGVSLRATANDQRMTGRFTATSGGSGQFDFRKQP